VIPKMKSYSELIKLDSFIDRFRYLKLNGSVFQKTFGDDRYMNQKFYTSYEWRKFRRDILLRDCGCDLGIAGREIVGKILIHHINPITPYDIYYRTDKLMDPENVICTQKITHDAIHYGDESLLFLDPIERRPFDTCPWR
jgi:hypothetical protein